MKRKQVKQVGQMSLLLARKYFPHVQKVNDADRSVMIEVTDEDDKAGRRLNSEMCAFARACARTFHADGMIVGVKVVFLIKGQVATRYIVPEAITREIISFDRGGGFDAGTYKLNKPTGVNRLGVGKSTRHKVRGNGQHKQFRHFTRRIRASILHH
jgi:hypothetical protein